MAEYLPSWASSKISNKAIVHCSVLPVFIVQQNLVGISTVTLVVF